MNTLLKITASLFVLFLYSACTSLQAPPPQMTQPKISVQLHSVKDAIDKDFKGTLTALAATGIDGVEFAGRFGPYKQDPEGLKRFINHLNLQVSGAHVPLNALKGKALPQTLHFYKTLGTTTLIIPFDSRANRPDKITAFTTELSALSQQLKAEGITLGYHNHAMEFTPFNGATFWDYIANNTPQNMALQLDIGWSNFAGQNAVKTIERYPGRTLTSHIKIRTTDDKTRWANINTNNAIIIGNDTFDWAKVFNTLITTGGTEWLVVEQEETYTGQTRLEAVSQSIQGVKRILAAL